MSLECSSHLFLVTKATLHSYNFHAPIRFNKKVSSGVYPHFFQGFGWRQTYLRHVASRKTARTHGASFGHVANADAVR